MAGFRKAKAEQAAVKMGIYGPSGSGKTFTTLLCAEGLAAITGKRIAFVDTERGTDFYCKAAPRRVHPEAFDFDALYTRSLTDTIAAVKSLNPMTHGVVVIDSITHLWEAARLAYSGKETSAGTIPFHAWAKIKKPYKELIALLLSSPMHVFLCGRQGNEFAEDEESGELKRVGVKMKAEGETPYEPHILLRLESERNKAGDGIIRAFAEKDRTGVLAGKTIEWPDFAKLIKPVLALLGGTQARVSTDDDVASHDAEALATEDANKQAESAKLLRRFAARFELADGDADVEAVAKELTPAVKKQMSTADVAKLREIYLAAKDRMRTDDVRPDDAGYTPPPDAITP